jgi:hypothetical protein
MTLFVNNGFLVNSISPPYGYIYIDMGERLKKNIYIYKKAGFYELYIFLWVERSQPCAKQLLYFTLKDLPINYTNKTAQYNNKLHLYHNIC